MSSPLSALFCTGAFALRGTYAKTLIGAVMLLLFISCTSEPKRSLEERISEEVTEKLAGWHARRNLTCRTAAMEIAIAQADAMILEYAREQKLQLERPSRPIRPVEPALRRPNDTLVLAPFLGDTL